MSKAMRKMYTPGSSTYHHYLTASQWRASYAPSKANVTAVKTYLRSEGFTGITSSGNRLLVSATGTAAQAQRAFSTTLVSYKLGGHTVFGNTPAAQVPASSAASCQP